MGISTDDAHLLFRLMDADGSGAIDIDEFCDGLFRLKGEAKSYDMHTALYTLKRMDSRLQELEEGAERNSLFQVSRWKGSSLSRQNPTVASAAGLPRQNNSIVVRLDV